MSKQSMSKLLYSVAFKLDNARTERKQLNVKAAVKLLIEIAGLGCLTSAGFHINSVVGWLVAGLAGFTLSYLLGPSKDEDKSIDPALRTGRR